jgi:putative transcriptional regulator
MTRDGTYRSSLLASVHETAKGLRDAGVMDKETMRKFDVMCLTPVRPLTAKQILILHRREKSQWKRGKKHPRGASLKLLTLVAKNGLKAVA